MKIKFVVMERDRGGDIEITRYDTYEEAEKLIMKTPSDLMGTVEYYIQKIWTNG